MGSLSKASSNQRKLALIIGNDSYSQPSNKLDQSVKNAKELGRLLETIEFQVRIKENVKSEISKTIKPFVDEFNIKADDLVLFYFLGHACQHDGTNWLIPTDDSRIGDINDVELFGSRVSRIFNELSGPNDSPCTVIGILDCCRPYNFTKGTTSVSKGLLEEKIQPGVFIQFACAANQTTNNNLFAKHLLRKIITPNKDIVQVFNEISNDVYKESSGTQKPLSINGLQGMKKVYLHEKTNLPVIPPNAAWKETACTVAGGRGHGKTLNRLNSPTGLCVDKNQHTLIVDSLNHRMMKFGQGYGDELEAKESIGRYNLGTLYKPYDVTWSTNEKNIIVSDWHNLQILKSSLKNAKLNTEFLNSFGCFGVAVADDGAIYVSNTNLHEVRRYMPGDTEGKVVAGGNGQGPRLKQLNHPTYICIGKNRSIYISDSFNDRVVRWDEDAEAGVVVAGGHGKGRRLDQLDNPTGIVVDSLSTVYVGDFYNGRVMRWRQGAKKGEIIAGDKHLMGNGSEKLNGPEGIAVDQDNNLYVADSNNHRVQQFEIK